MAGCRLPEVPIRDEGAGRRNAWDCIRTTDQSKSMHSIVIGKDSGAGLLELHNLLRGVPSEIQDEAYTKLIKHERHH
jgi:hypothetical protein